ncbi:hypothetical protein C4D60_Mb08t29190 [Musa balbisiana]|uniref:SHSP domain-containing protein n=1 Tax=Musa balbisiana TaxID=52838 RepID=A0A4S8K7D8_MUSBA|nr:hypothetical protein C4D60_Mb08t29190 [Musa balbisiana]
MRPPFSAALLLPLLLLVPVWLGATPSSGLLLPWLDRAGSPLSDRFPDPFRILEHIPFGLDRDDMEFRLPDNADLDSVSAKLEDGVLTVALPKLAPEKISGPRVVSIAGGDDAGDKEKLQGSSSEAKKVDL